MSRQDELNAAFAKMAAESNAGLLEKLDGMVRRVGRGADDGFWVLSTGEQVYVALAANRFDLLTKMDFTIAQALWRLDPGWSTHLEDTWRLVSLHQMKTGEEG